MKQQKKDQQTEAQRRKQSRAHDVAVFDAMCASRPRTPPPLRMLAPTLTDGAAALAKEKRLGLYDGRRGAEVTFLHSSNNDDDSGNHYTVRVAAR